MEFDQHSGAAPANRGADTSAADPLPSWANGAVKSAILSFVARVTNRRGTDFVLPVDRIATFDNDGTLWCEQPAQVQVLFAQARLKQLADQDPTMREREPFKAFFEHDMAALGTLGKERALSIAFAIHAGMTSEEFEATAAAWLATARHPTLGRHYTENVYVPQLELMAFLRASGFRVFIVSGGGIDFIRVFSERKYGVPRDQVIGSSVKSRFELRNGVGEIVKLAELDSFDDREMKPANIYLHIGRRPILAFGNSDGDLPMLRYVRTGDGPRLALLLHHDDAAREFAYDREFRLSPLIDGLDRTAEYGLTPVSMKQDWKRVFANPVVTGKH